MAQADVSPTMAVLFLTAGVFTVGGTFAIGANLILAVAVVLIALCLAEFGAMYPIAGGKLLTSQKRASCANQLDHHVQLPSAGSLIPASLMIGCATFLKTSCRGSRACRRCSWR